MHEHSLRWIPKTDRIVCDGCSIDLRLATYREAVFVQNTNAYAPDGPMLFRGSSVVVPRDFKMLAVV